MSYKVKHLVSKSIYAKMGHPVPTKAFLQLSPDMAMLFAPTGVPTPHFYSCWTYLQRTLPEVK